MADLDNTRFWQILPRLQSIRNKLDVIRTGLGPTPSLEWKAVGRDLTKAEFDYGNLVSEYQRIRVAIGFDPAPGLSGIPILPVLVVAIAAVFAALVVLETFALALYQKYRAAEAQAAADIERQRTGAQEMARLDQEIAEAQQEGDTAREQQLRAQRNQLSLELTAAPAGVPGEPETPFEFFRENWPWLALAAGGLLIGPKLVDAFSNR